MLETIFGEFHNFHWKFQYCFLRFVIAFKLALTLESPAILKDVLETVKSSGVNLTEEQLLNFIRNGGLQTEVN